MGKYRYAVVREVAALAALFQVPIEALWQKRAENPDEHETETTDEREAEVQGKSKTTGRAADAEQMTADYYSEQRYERLRDK